ncbi:NUDIX hydrolase [Gaiella sp.]|uniref:NUDIX hydrolase n=1 Tax=Gaiella sp. TaxID=2663207 RepID=UPI003262F266
MARNVAKARRGGAAGSPLSKVVRAAGGIVIRGVGPEGEVLLVHRPQYDDWTFPKGKVEPGESDEECAIREVEEETGLRCSLARELEPTSYLDAKKRPKTVRYWVMEVVAGALHFDFEVDVARWVTVDEAAKLLTYPRDVDLLLSVWPVRQ